MDSDLAWVNGKSVRQSWRYADAFQRSIKSEAIYHFTYYTIPSTLDYKFLFNYFQLWRSYARLSATTQRIFTFHLSFYF